MKNLVTWVFAIMIIGAALLIFEQSSVSSRPANEKEGDKLSAASKQMNMLWWTRAYPDPTHINAKYMRAWEKAKTIPDIYEETYRTGRTSAGAWVAIGPKTLGGRMLCVAINPLRHTTIYAGSASGGIWKSYTGGVGTNAWEPVETGLPTLGVTSILVHPTDTSILYAATGEVYRVDSTSGNPNPGNTSYNVWKTRGTYSVGMLKSIDGGDNWTQAFARDLPDMSGIQKIRFHPTDPDIVFICATDGLYRYDADTDIATKIFDVTYVSDVLVNPANQDVIIAAVGNLQNSVKGIYRTVNGANATPTWAEATTTLPSSFQGFISFDHHAASNTVYASIGRSSSSTTELYRSTDFGATWSGISNSGHSRWQYWFAHACAVDPNNVNRVFLFGVDKKRLTISGTTGTSANVASGSAYMGTYIAPGGQEGPSSYVHDDVHAITYVPNRSDSLYLCTDGGIFLSTNANTGTASSVTFQSCNSGLQTAQLYGPVGQSSTDANFFVAGLQDNNTAVYNGATGRWKREIGGDGGPSQVKPDNDNIVLSSRDARAVYRSTNKGGSYGGAIASYWGSVADSRTGFMAPLVWSKSNTNVVYLASDNLHKSTDAGVSFSNNAYSTATNYIEAVRKTAVAMEVSPTNENIVVVSTSPFAQFDNDADGIHYNPPVNLMKTTTGNTPFTSIYTTGLPTSRRYILDIAFHPSNNNIIFVTLGGFGTSHVYKTINGGTTWTDIDNGWLPDVPTNAIMLDPMNSNTIYVGNDLGVYISTNGGSSWYSFNGGLWDATMVIDLVAVPGNKIRAATHGKGVFESVLYSGTLPVNITTFTASHNNGVNKLLWITDNETSLKHYELEKSLNGTSFSKIGTINAVNQSAQQTYSYDDAVGITRSAIYYYRLKSVNLDGTSAYSKIVKVEVKGKNALQILTNPVVNSIRLQVTAAERQAIVFNLFDAKGRLLRREKHSVDAGINVITLEDISNQAKGLYVLEAVIDRQRYTIKLTKN